MERTQVLERAKECITGQRITDYGKPEDNFQTIAVMWTVYLNNDIAITAADVANMMILLKVSRQVHGNGGIDCAVDIAGYAACLGELMDT